MRVCIRRFIKSPFVTLIVENVFGSKGGFFVEYVGGDKKRFLLKSGDTAVRPFYMTAYPLQMTI
jgi:hypothetical protein